MSTTIIAMYDNADKAEKAVNEIVRAGVSRDAVDVLQGDGNGNSAVVGKLTERGVERQEAAIYAEAIGKGSLMVAVEAPEETAQDAYEIMNRFGARDLEQLVAEAEGANEERESVPVVEEEVSIGKRTVLRGGVRVTSTVKERPVEETVKLREENVEVEWSRIWNIQPIMFDETLVGFAEDAVREVSGTSHRLPSGPLHDAAEVARAGVPTVMLFVQSLRGLSHTKLEDTKPEHLELAVEVLDRLAQKVLDRKPAA